MGRLFYCRCRSPGEAQRNPGLHGLDRPRISLRFIRATISMQAAEGVDQHQNRNRHAEQPQQKITSHDELLHHWFDADSMREEVAGFLVQNTRTVVRANAGTHTPWPA